MKIMCYGDSNTWGYMADGTGRFDTNTRWTTVMGSILGEGYSIVEDGVCGRTSLYSDNEWCSVKGEKESSFLSKTMKKHYPFDMMIIMLGTNDLRPELNLSPKAISENVAHLVERVLNFNYDDGGKPPKIILVSPPHIEKGVSTSPDASMFGLGEDSVEKSKEFAEHFKARADELGLYFFDAAPYTKASELDSLHLDEQSHKSLAQAMADFVKSM